MGASFSGVAKTNRWPSPTVELLQSFINVMCDTFFKGADLITEKSHETCSEMTLVSKWIVKFPPLVIFVVVLKSLLYDNVRLWPFERGGRSVSLRLLTPTVLVEVTLQPDPCQVAPRQIQS